MLQLGKVTLKRDGELAQTHRASSHVRLTYP